MSNPTEDAIKAHQAEVLRKCRGEGDQCPCCLDGEMRIEDIKDFGPGNQDCSLRCNICEWTLGEAL